MRLLAGLALLAPVGLALLLVLMPALAASLVGGPEQVVESFAAGLLGVSLTTMLVLGWVRFRLQPLITAAERIAAGEQHLIVALPRHGAMGRLGRAIGELGEAMATTYEAATVDKLTGVANRQALLMTLFNEVERASRYGRP